MLRDRILNQIIPSINTQPFIGSKFTSILEETRLTIKDPTTEKKIIEFAVGGKQDAHAAVAATRNAFDKGPWPKMTYSERAKYLCRLADLIDAHTEEIALLESLTSGRVLKGVKAWDVPHASELLRYYASNAEDHCRENHIPNTNHYIRKEPVGVCAQILPWNFPFPSIFWKMAPALAVGCTVIIKPSERTPLGAQYLARLIQEADFPSGVINIINGCGNTVGTELVSDKRIDKISFTGSISTAQKILSNAAHNLPRFSLELGGKNANIVCADADLEAAVQGTYSAMFGCAGQNCCAASRTYVHDSIFKPFLKQLLERTEKRVLGDPLEDTTEQGPQIDLVHLERIEGFVNRVKNAGNILCGGKRVARDGYFFAPTIISDVNPSSEIAREEVFGPVGCVFMFDDLDEVIKTANDSSYGLAAGIWTAHHSTTERFINEMRVGTCWINCFNSVEPNLPFGGYKMSGQGRELGLEALDNYTECKTVMSYKQF